MYSIENLKILLVCAENVGRSQLATVTVKQQFAELGIVNSVLSAGVNDPESGRTTMHPAVVDLARTRFDVDISTNEIKRIIPAMVDINTLVVVFCRPELIPDFVLQQAFDVLIASVADPYPDLVNALDKVTTEIWYFGWLLSYILNKKDERLGNNNDENGWVRPRFLEHFEPVVEEKYSRSQFGKMYWYNKF